jgi:hypothetical protein
MKRKFEIQEDNNCEILFCQSDTLYMIDNKSHYLPSADMRNCDVI